MGCVSVNSSCNNITDPAMCRQVVLEFPVDDTAGGEKEDALTEMGFYVPKDAPGWDGGEHAAKVGPLVTRRLGPVHRGHAWAATLLAGPREQESSRASDPP